MGKNTLTSQRKNFLLHSVELLSLFKYKNTFSKHKRLTVMYISISAVLTALRATSKVYKLTLIQQLFTAKNKTISIGLCVLKKKFLDRIHHPSIYIYMRIIEIFPFFEWGRILHDFFFFFFQYLKSLKHAKIVPILHLFIC